LFKTLRISPYIKPAIGGLITGIIGYLFLVAFNHPFVLGMGYGYVQMAIEGKLALYVLILIIFGKIIATSFTIGSGGSGGVFAPSIVIGSMVGGAVGLFFHELFPEVVTQPEAYILVGMGAFVAGVAKTPMAAIIMVLEMTGGYNLLPALMLASVVSYKITGDNSMYIEQVPTRIESPAHRDEMLVDVLENVSVREAMIPADKVVTVSPENTILEVLRMIEKTGHMGYPVVENGELVGIIVFEDVEKVPVEKRGETKVKDVMTTKLVVTYPDESLEDALKKLAANNIGRLPVVDRSNEKKLLGMLTRSDIMKAHAREVAKLGK
jgi:CIC family chloride channel protein